MLPCEVRAPPISFGLDTRLKGLRSVLKVLRLEQFQVIEEKVEFLLQAALSSHEAANSSEHLESMFATMIEDMKLVKRSLLAARMEALGLTLL